MKQIFIKFLTRYLKKDKRKLALLVRRAMRLLTIRYTLSVVLVDNKQIQQLNRRFLKRNSITDVIAFPLEDKFTAEAQSTQSKKKNNGHLFGEIIVSVEKALTEARIRKIHPHQEIIRYCVHGLLHLLGYDDHRPKDRKQMWNRQEQILAEFL